LPLLLFQPIRARELLNLNCEREFEFESESEARWQISSRAPCLELAHWLALAGL